MSAFSINGTVNPALPVARWSLSCPGSCRLHVGIRLGEVRLGWVRLGWVVLGWVGLGWVRLG